MTDRIVVTALTVLLLGAVALYLLAPNALRNPPGERAEALWEMAQGGDATLDEFNELAGLLEAKDDRERALALSLRALRSRPEAITLDGAEFHVALALALNRDDLAGEAIEAWNGIRENPDDTLAFSNVLENMGAADLALRLIEESAAYGAGDANLQLQASRIRTALGVVPALDEPAPGEPADGADLATPAPEESAIDIEQANVAQPPASLGPAQQAGETVSALAAEEVQDSADAEALGSRAADTAREALGVPGQLSAGEQADQPSQMATRQQLGRSEVHAQALIRQAEDPATSSDERRAIAFALLEIGRNDDAERIFQSLAAAAGPISPYTQTLNWLWGPRPDGQELQWMMEAARQAPVAERVGWINRILTAGAPREAAALAEELLRQSNDAGLLDVAIRAHIVLGDRQNVDRLLLPAVDRIDGAAMAEYFARLAEEAGADYAASILYEKAARLEPQRNELLGRAGILAGRLSQAERARPMLEEYVGRGGQSPEASFALAEYNFEDGKFTRARAGFEAVIGASNRAPSNPTLLRLKALSLLRLRRETEAYDVFVKLIAMVPADLELRADAGAALLNAGRPNEAARVLRYRNGNTTKSRRR